MTKLLKGCVMAGGTGSTGGTGRTGGSGSTGDANVQLYKRLHCPMSVLSFRQVTKTRLTLMLDHAAVYRHGVVQTLSSMTGLPNASSLLQAKLEALAVRGSLATLEALASRVGGHI